MPSRYDGKLVVINSNEQYREMLNNRGIKYFRQFSTPELRMPTAEEIRDLQTIGHIWSLGDRFYKLAHKYYGDPSLWWIIGHYNQLPTENHVKIGQTVYVPLPLDRVLQVIGV